MDALASTSNACVVCGASHLEEIRTTKSASTRTGKPIEFESVYTKCNSCGVELVYEEQSVVNQRRFLEAEKAADRLMSKEAIRTLINKHKLSVRKAGQLFGGGEIAFSKYYSGETTPAASMDALLYVANNIPEVIPLLAKERGVKLSVEATIVSPDHSPIDSFRIVSTGHSCAYRNQVLGHSFYGKQSAPIGSSIEVPAVANDVLFTPMLSANRLTVEVSA